MEVLLKQLPAQADFYECEDRVAALVGGLGYGKTRTASEWMLTCAAKYSNLPDELWIFSNTYSQLISGTLHTFFERCDDWGVRYIDRVHYEKKIYLPELKAVINVRSADRPINFKSLEIFRAWIDEAQAYSRDAYNKILGRRRGSDRQRALYPDEQSQIRLTANPPHTMTHWLPQGCTVPHPETGRPPITLFTASTYDNPFLDSGYIEDLEAQYDADLAEIELGGKFGTLGTGKIWRSFDRQLHVLSSKTAELRGLPPLEYDPHLPLCWSFDFNIDPLSSILFQWRDVNVPGYRRRGPVLPGNPQFPGVMYVLDEIRIRHSMIDHAVREFVENRPAALAIGRRNGVHLYGDASGSAGNRQTGKSDWDAVKMGLAANGLSGEARLHDANPKVRDRYNAGNSMLVNSLGEVGVVIHERCRYLALDLEAMVYKPGTSIVDDKAKLADGATATHLGDAWSYPIEYEFPVRMKPQEIAANISRR